MIPVDPLEVGRVDLAEVVADRFEEFDECCLVVEDRLELISHR